MTEKQTQSNPTCSELACGEQGRTVEVSNLFQNVEKLLALESFVAIIIDLE